MCVCVLCDDNAANAHVVSRSASTIFTRCRLIRATSRVELPDVGPVVGALRFGVCVCVCVCVSERDREREISTYTSTSRYIR